MQKRAFREWIGYVLLWLCFFWVSCLCALLIDLLILKIVKTIVVLPFEVEAILHVITMLVGAAIPLSAISYMISFHLAEFSLLHSTAEGAVAAVLHLLVGFLLGFPVWITGGVKWLAGLMEYGTRLYHAETLNDVALRYYLLSFVVFLLFYLAVKTAFGVLGKRNRIRQRKEMMDHLPSSHTSLQ